MAVVAPRRDDRWRGDSFAVVHDRDVVVYRDIQEDVRMI